MPRRSHINTMQRAIFGSTAPRPLISLACPRRRSMICYE
jgi:hypothetical protein